MADFRELGAVEARLAGYDACFYCAGVSSVGMSEADYTVATYDTPVAFATTLARLDPDMVLDARLGRAHGRQRAGQGDVGAREGQDGERAHAARFPRGL